MTVATVAAGAMSAAGTIMGGNAAAAAGQVSAARSISRRRRKIRPRRNRGRLLSARALEKDRQATLLQSTLQANAAASGGGAADPTVIGLGQDIAGRGEYQSLMDMYTGENRARGIEDQAIGSRLTGDAQQAEGEAKRTASYLSAAGTLVGSAGSAYRTYNKIPDVRYG
jgi:hypothetical protein